MSRGLYGIVKRDKLLATVFIIQGFVNLVSFGITPYMMIAPVTRYLPPIFVYVELAFVLLYPSLGALGILLLSKAFELGRRISMLYLGMGILVPWWLWLIAYVFRGGLIGWGFSSPCSGSLHPLSASTW